MEEEEIAREKEKGLFPTAKVESVEENLKKASLSPEEYRQYCQKLFLFKEIKVKNFKSWNDRRNYFKQAQREMIEEAKKSADKGTYFFKNLILFSDFDHICIFPPKTRHQIT